MNDYNVLFPRYEEGEVDVGRGVYETTTNQINQPLSMRKREDFVSEWLR